MRKSDIFESFVKIAQEKGIISEDTPEKAKKKLEQTGRADSLDLSAIEALYGVKPNTPKDMEYERNIIEDAHPNSVVISPSYDKLHGLVENENERQNISLNILHKTPNGHSTQHKYARQQLLLSLVRIGNDLDNKNQDKLRVLADTCLFQLEKKKFNKVAVPLIPIIGIAAILLGGAYAASHIFSDEGFDVNHKKLISQIDDLINANSNLGVGYDLDPIFKQTMSNFKEHLEEFYNVYLQAKSSIIEMDLPRTAPEIIQLLKQPKSQQDAQQIIQVKNNLHIASAKLQTEINKILKNFSSEMYKQMQIKDKGFLTSLIDKTQLLHGGKTSLIADDFEDVKNALITYLTSFKLIVNKLQQSKTMEDQLKQELNEAALADNQMWTQQNSSSEMDEPPSVLKNR